MPSNFDGRVFNPQVVLFGFCDSPLLKEGCLGIFLLIPISLYQFDWKLFPPKIKHQKGPTRFGALKGSWNFHPDPWRSDPIWLLGLCGPFRHFRYGHFSFLKLGYCNISNMWVSQAVVICFVEWLETNDHWPICSCQGCLCNVETLLPTRGLPSPGWPHATWTSGRWVKWEEPKKPQCKILHLFDGPEIPAGWWFHFFFFTPT